MHDGKARQSVDDPHVLLGYLAEDGVSVSPLVVRPGGDEEVGTSTNDARESPLDERGALPGQVRARADAEAALNEGVGRAGAAVVVDGAGLGHRLGAMELAASARLLTTRKVAEVRGSDGGEVLAEGDAHVALVGVQHQGSGGAPPRRPRAGGHGESHDLAHAPDMYAGFRSHSPMFAQRARFLVRVDALATAARDGPLAVSDERVVAVGRHGDAGHHHQRRRQRQEARGATRHLKPTHTTSEEDDEKTTKARSETSRARIRARRRVAAAAMSDRIAPGSTLIRNTLNARLDAVEAGVTTHELLQLSASEFDDVRLGIQSADGPNLVVSIGGPTGVLPAGAQEVAAGRVLQYAKVRATRETRHDTDPFERSSRERQRVVLLNDGNRSPRGPRCRGVEPPAPGFHHPRPRLVASPPPCHLAGNLPVPPCLLPLILSFPLPLSSTPLPAGALTSPGGFDLSLEIDLSSIPKERAARVAVVEHLASLRCVVYGTTLRNYFAALAAGTSSDGPLVAIAHGHERRMVTFDATRTNRSRVPQASGEDASDAVVAQTFLAMFNEAKRQPALSTAPTCSYAKPGSPPMELSEGGVAWGNARRKRRFRVLRALQAPRRGR